VSTIRLLTATIPLVLVVALVTSSSEAAPPIQRGTAATPANRKPPARKQLKLSPEVQARLTQSTATQKPVRHVPFTSKEVRSQIPANKRPARATGKAKPKRVSNTELTNELNAIERKLNAQGYSLRDNRTVVVHEHVPDRVKLEKQVSEVARVVETKPKRAPLTGSQLRAKVRSSVKPPRHRAKPPVRRTVGPGIETNGFWVQQDAIPAASSDFQWTPVIGEPDVGSAFLDTRASFSGAIGGIDSGLHGSIVVTAGAYVLNQRLDALRVDATMDASLEGTYEAAVTATLAGGFAYPLYQDTGTHPIAVGDTLNVFDYDQKYSWIVPVVGYPVTVELTVSPSITVGFDAELDEASLIGSVRPELRLEATLEAYVDAILARAGAGGTAVLISASPELWGAAYFGEEAGQTTVNSHLSGNVRLRCLEGRIYLFMELGIWPFEIDLEWELMDYPGWEWTYPIFEWSSSHDR
jgi:hypothetical protein